MKKEKKTHAKYSASGAYRWLKCPGSIQLSEKAPEQRESDYAIEGTKAHELLEKLMKGKPFSKKNYPSDMVKIVTKSYKEIRELTAYAPAVISEGKACLPEYIGVNLFGTVDVIAIEEFGTLTIIDFKYGAGIAVDPKDNPQLMYYALGISHQFKHNFERVKLIIVQPRAFHSEGTTRVHEIEMWELKQFEDQLSDGIKACEDPLAPFMAGDHCRFCPAVTICPEVSSKALEKAKIEFGEKKSFMLPEIDSLPQGSLNEILDAGEKIEIWIEKVKEHAFHLLNRGVKIDGWKLVEKRGIRKWLDIDKTSKEAKRKFKSSAFTEPQLLSPAQLEKLVGKEWVDSRTTSISSGLKLARDTDGRSGTSQIEKDFA